jgi:hypothetical protein
MLSYRSARSQIYRCRNQNCTYPTNSSSYALFLAALRTRFHPKDIKQAQKKRGGHGKPVTHDRFGLHCHRKHCTIIPSSLEDGTLMSIGLPAKNHPWFSLPRSHPLPLPLPLSPFFISQPTQHLPHLIQLTSLTENQQPPPTGVSQP